MIILFDESVKSRYKHSARCLSVDFPRNSKFLRFIRTLLSFVRIIFVKFYKVQILATEWAIVIKCFCSPIFRLHPDGIVPVS